MTKVYLTEQEASSYFDGLGISYSAGTLCNMRVRGDGPPFVKLGRRVRYRREDIDNWLGNRPLMTSTSGR